MQREKRWIRVKALTAEEKAAFAAACQHFIAETLKPRFLPEILFLPRLRRLGLLQAPRGNDAYGEAAGVIGRMAALRGAAEQAAYVAAIKQRHGRKRNFMKLLG